MTGMADGGGGNNGNGAPVESPQPVKPKKARKRKKKSESPDEQSNGSGSCIVSGCAAPDGDGKEKEANNNKKDRLVWCPKLHGKFVKACKELGAEDAVPMKILRRMNTNGVKVTRAQVASHLQKYRYSLSKRQEARTIAVHQTPLHEASASPSQPTAPPEALPPSVPPPPPQPQAPLEAPDTMCQPPLGHVQLLETLPNCHGSNHTAVAADLLHHQQLQLLVAPPVQQQCFAPPFHVQPSEEVNTLVVPNDEETATGMVHLQVGANDQEEQAPATEPEADAASYWDPPCSIFERYWGSDVPQPSWDLFGVPETDYYMDALLAAISTPTRDK